MSFTLKSYGDNYDPEPVEPVFPIPPPDNYDFPTPDFRTPDQKYNDTVDELQQAKDEYLETKEAIEVMQSSGEEPVGDDPNHQDEYVTGNEAAGNLNDELDAAQRLMLELAGWLWDNI